MSLALPAHAKLNLELEVHGRRPDGYHEITTLLQAISLHDLLLGEPAPVTELLVAGQRAPNDASNLVLRALAGLEQAVGRSLPTRFKLVKRIPSGAGLGGGSSDAAAALRLLVRIHRLEVDLVPVAARLGADVPFFLKGGRAWARGRGDELTYIPAEPGWFAVAWPGVEMGTGGVYEAADEVGQDLAAAAAALSPEVADFARRLGPGWRMTGTGSAHFATAPTQAAAEGLIAGIDCWTAVVRAVPGWA